MFAVYAARQSADEPLTGLETGERPEPQAPDGWAKVAVKAASLNHHDLWSLKGVGLPANRLPMILGCDAAGVDEDGNEVVVHSVVSDPAWHGDETDDPKRSILSEVHDGTLAEYVVVPKRNLIPKPPELSFVEAACLPTAYLTAYRMLFTKARLQPGQSVLIQGAGGGVATALTVLARAAGLRVWVTSRDESKGQRAVDLGAHQAFPSGERLPDKVDAVMETVGEATWAHSLRAVKNGGIIVTCGATSGSEPPADLKRVFFLQLQILGSTMGTRSELDHVVRMFAANSIKPVIDREIPMTTALEGFEALADGEVFGKIVLTL